MIIAGFPKVRAQELIDNLQNKWNSFLPKSA